MYNILCDAIQSNFAPLTSMVLFFYLIRFDTLISKRIKKLFFCETLFVFLMMIVVISENILSSVHTPIGRGARSIVNVFYFGLAPIALVLTTMIYRDISKEKWKDLFLVPEIANFVICALSTKTGWVFYVNSDNIYQRGPLFPIPFIVTAGYYLIFIYIVTLQPKKSSVVTETIFLVFVFVCITGAIAIEIKICYYYMTWSVTYICEILYFLLLNLHRIFYDPLTDTFTRLACSRKLEEIDGKKPATIAIIDLNDLKFFNDTYGHSAGDTSIVTMVLSVMKNKTKTMRIYRYGGDEFIIIDKGCQTEELKIALENARNGCGYVEGNQVSFAYGISEYSLDQDLNDVISEADNLMYIDKKIFKQNVEKKES